MLLPGVQTILGFQLMAVFNERFERLSEVEQLVHYGAFLLTALTMGLMMAPVAYHRQAERDRVTRRFVKLASRLLTIAMIPFIVGMSLDAYLVGQLVSDDTPLGLIGAAGMLLILSTLWFLLPAIVRKRR